MSGSRKLLLKQGCCNVSSQEGGKYPDHLPPCCRSPPDNPNGTDIYVSAIVDHLVSVDDSTYKFEVCIPWPSALSLRDGVHCRGTLHLNHVADSRRRWCSSST